MKPEVHQALTKRAIAIYEKRQDRTISKNFSNRIVYGTKAEDNLTPSRLWNWHFFRQNNEILEKTRFLRMRPTSETIFNKHVKKLQSTSKESLVYYEYLGRIIHHIQDMNTPSHVIPIYHALKPKDLFETFMCDALNDTMFNPEIPQEQSCQKDTLYYNYKCVAQETLTLLENTHIITSVNGHEDSLPLTVLWQNHQACPDRKNPGFGHFTKDCKIFADKSDSSIIVDGMVHTVTLEEKHRINNMICGKAIRDTINIFEFVKL